MEILIGLLIIAIGSFCQSSSYVPINKVEGMELGKLLVSARCICLVSVPVSGFTAGGVPAGGSLFDLWGAGGAGMSIFYGILWGNRRVDFRTFHALFGCCARTKYLTGYLCRFRYSFPAIFAGTKLV